MTQRFPARGGEPPSKSFYIKKYNYLMSFLIRIPKGRGLVDEACARLLAGQFRSLFIKESEFKTCYDQYY
jgi:hypothetical protein